VTGGVCKGVENSLGESVAKLRCPLELADGMGGRLRSGGAFRGRSSTNISSFRDNIELPLL
jgi:hypothetical protein